MLPAAVLQICLFALPTLGLRASALEPSRILTATASVRLNYAATASAGQKYFGTAADLPGAKMEDEYYMHEFCDPLEFGSATPANVMKFDATEPEQGVFDFSGGDEFVQIAKESGKNVRCHSLIWWDALPWWVQSPSTPWTYDTLSAALANHVYTVVQHYGNDCHSWDVVNEAFNDDGSHCDSIWLDVLGPEYIPIAFGTAQQAIEDNDLDVKLYYNDYGIEWSGPKATAVQTLVKELQDRGIQIDGVGLQSHFYLGSTPSYDTQVENMQAFTSLGIEVAVSELDIRMELPASAEDQIQQAQEYYDTVSACVEVDGCVGVTVWDFVDTYSWVPAVYSGQGYADLFLQEDGSGTPLVKKVAHDACVQALSRDAFSI